MDLLDALNFSAIIQRFLLVSLLNLTISIQKAGRTTALFLLSTLIRVLPEFSGNKLRNFLRLKLLKE